MTLREELMRRVIPRVHAPAQYAGGELNAVVKDHRGVSVTFCLAFPDTYAVGMSQTGLHILYGTLNARQDVAAERAFAPWVDMAGLLAQEGLPLYSLETFTPLRDFDIVGFSLQYEMGYTNVLAMLEMAGIPVLASQRGLDDPLIVAGGPGASNPEPLADFVDVFAPGDGEEAVHRLVDAYKTARASATGREELCHAIAASGPGFYCPALYSPGYPRVPRFADVPAVVQSSVVHDLNGAFYPTSPIVPYAEIVHDRITLEIMRGCARGCRYCQAGMTKRPVRERSVENLIDTAEKSYLKTGHSEISLASLSTSDYTGFNGLATQLSSRFDTRFVNLAVPSLRVNDQLKAIPALLNSVRKAGLTIAPEAGTDRLRRVINKDITDDDLMAGAEAAFQQGWQRVKLYFMCGLPTETDEDIVAMVSLAERVSALGRKVAGRAAQVSMNVAPFVPKPHTPFQWEAMVTPERIKEIRALVLSRVRSRAVEVKFHKPERSFLEGVFSRGDSRLGQALMEARKRGCWFDAWDEVFDYGAWMAAFEAAGIDAQAYACRGRSLDEPLPWAHISAGPSPEFLLGERQRAMEGIITPFCSEAGCQGCGLPRCDRRDAV